MLHVHDIGIESVEDRSDARRHRGVAPGPLESSPDLILDERERLDIAIMPASQGSCPTTGIQFGEQDAHMIPLRLPLRESIGVDFHPPHLLRQIVMHRVENPHSMHSTCTCRDSLIRPEERP